MQMAIILIRIYTQGPVGGARPADRQLERAGGMCACPAGPPDVALQVGDGADPDGGGGTGGIRAAPRPASESA